MSRVGIIGSKSTVHVLEAEKNGKQKDLTDFDKGQTVIRASP